MLTVRDVLQRSEAYLAQRDVDSPRLSAQLMVSHGLGLSRLDLFLQLDRQLGEPELAVIRELAARRGRGEPAAYILGVREFYGLDFKVTPAVLIPRPETEHLVEAVLERFPKDAEIRFADLGTGSGALAVALAVDLPSSLCVAVDDSGPALAVARDNARSHGVEDRLVLARADMGRLPVPDGRLDAAVSNPPYISEADYDRLDREVREYEPRRALTPGSTGLEALEAAAQAMSRALKPGGLAVLEIGFDQGEAVQNLLKGLAYSGVQIIKDLSGCDRVALGFAR